MISTDDILVVEEEDVSFEQPLPSRSEQRDAERHEEDRRHRKYDRR